MCILYFEDQTVRSFPKPKLNFVSKSNYTCVLLYKWFSFLKFRLSKTCDSNTPIYCAWLWNIFLRNYPFDRLWLHLKFYSYNEYFILDDKEGLETYATLNKSMYSVSITHDKAIEVWVIWL